MAGDLLRPQDDAFRPAQDGNVLWLHRLLRRPVAAATGLPVLPLTWDATAEAPGFDTPAFYALAGAEPSVEGWAALFDAPDLPWQAAALLARAFDGAAGVIGFELPALLRRLLTRLRIPFLDLGIHPVRFGPDLMLAADTNHDGIWDALRGHHAEDDDLAPWADILAAAALKMPPDRPVTEAVLVAGQTRVDRALIEHGRLVDLSDHAAALRAAVGAEGGILFRPHPYNPGDFGLHDCAIPLRRIREAREATYVLLAHPAIRRVVAVSSSLLEEARHFGKQAVALGTPPYRIAPTRAALGPGRHATLAGGFLDADLWRDLLAPALPVTARDGRRLALPPDTLRGALRQFWGRDEIFLQLPVELALARIEARRDV